MNNMEFDKFVLVIIEPNDKKVRIFTDFESAIQDYWSEIGFRVWQHIRKGDFDVSIWRSEKKAIVDIVRERFGDVNVHVFQSILIEDVETYIALVGILR